MTLGTEHDGRRAGYTRPEVGRGGARLAATEPGNPHWDHPWNIRLLIDWQLGAKAAQGKS